MLMAALGPAGPGIPPVVSIDEPANGATVDPGFHVYVTATDDVGVDRVELYIDGALSSTVSLPPYVFNTPETLAPGAHNVEARAYDAGGVNSHMIGVTVADAGGGPDCETNDDCPAGFVCNAAGSCVPDGGGGDCTSVGCACDDAADCASGLCLSNGSESYCSERCDPAADSCPNGTECVSTTGDDSVCWPGSGGGDDGTGSDVVGGCRVGGDDRGAAWLLLAFVGIARARRARARRRFSR
jgi:hypothetical protein